MLAVRPERGSRTTAIRDHELPRDAGRGDGWSLETPITAADLYHLRFILRERHAGDVELLRDLRERLASRYSEAEVQPRIAFVDRLAERVGALF